MSWVAAALLALLTVIAYLPAFQAEFIWDDRLMIYDNPHVRADDGLRHIWTSTESSDYFPLTMTSFWFEWRWWGMDARYYHATNILLHALAVIVLWRVMLRLNPANTTTPAVAWFIAALFAVHPVTVMSVAWIAERKNTLSLLLVLLSLLTYLRFEDAQSRRRWLWYVTAMLLFLLALLAKTSVVALPAVVMLLAWWRRGRVKVSDLFATAPLFVIAMLMGLVTIWFQHHNVIRGLEVRPESFASRLAAAGWCIWFYLGKAVWPLNLAAVYPRWQVDPANITHWIPLAALLVLAGFAWRARQSWGKALLVAMGCYIAILLPVLGLISMGYHRLSLVSDHLHYPALIVPVTLFVAAGHRLISRWRASRGLDHVLAAIVLIALAGLTWKKAHAYRTAESLWLDTIFINDRAWIAYNNLGLIRNYQGKMHDAVELYERAITIFPEAAEAYNNLGMVWHQLGDFDLAIENYRLSIEHAPKYPPPHFNLASALEVQGQSHAAIEQYRVVLQLQPQATPARFALANQLRIVGQLDEAIEHYRMVLAVEPDDPEVHEQLATALASRGDMPAAAEHFERVVSINPHDPDARYNLALAMSFQGQTSQALEQLRIAIELQPRSADALSEAAWLLATRMPVDAGHAREAVELAERAAQLTNQRSAHALDVLAASYAAAGRFDDAIAAAERALTLAHAQQQPGSQAMRNRLDLYRAGQAYREAQ